MRRFGSTGVVGDKLSLRMFVDPISPYAWLSCKSIPNLRSSTKSNFDIEVVPVLFAGLLKAHHNIGPAEIEAKRKYTFSCVLRHATKRGLKLSAPPVHPFNPLLALRVCTSLDCFHERELLMTSLMDAAWSNGLDLEDPGVIRDVANSIGFDGDSLVTCASKSSVKRLLIENTESASKLGVFGVPTFYVKKNEEEELFWGLDSMEHLVDYLNGDLLAVFSSPLLKQVLSRPQRHRLQFSKRKSQL